MCDQICKNSRGLIRVILQYTDFITNIYIYTVYICLFLDLSKAFDSVPHERLLLKLQFYGVGGALLDWLRCFLTTRRQRVVLNGSFSSWLPVISGVPQGSILGPLLFSVYLNDIANFVRCKIKLFADDVTLYHQLFLKMIVYFYKTT